MHINSRLFGEIDVDDNKIITFESGIIGFDECRHFTLLYDSEKGNQRSIMWLQSVERPELAFPVADPMSISREYNPIVEDEWLEPIGEIKNEEDIYVLVILTVPSDLTRMTANLKAPVIINTGTMKGCQLIVNNEEYQVRDNVYDYIQELKKGGK